MFTTTLSLLLLLLLGFSSVTHAHPTRYSRDKLRIGKDGVPQPLSYHVHLTYMASNEKQVQTAAALQDQARKHFKDYLGEDCVGLFDFGRLCVLVDGNATESGDSDQNPFPIGNWAMFVPVPYYSLVVQWFVQHRGDFSVVVHPNSGFEYEDHSSWALWSGQPWQLDLSGFTSGQQTGEFDHHPGDAGNPQCAGYKSVCGDLHQDSHNVTVLCCPQLACNCKDQSPICMCE
jgi:hypothetical protein